MRNEAKIIAVFRFCFASFRFEAKMTVHPIQNLVARTGQRGQEIGFSHIFLPELRWIFNAEFRESQIFCKNSNFRGVTKNTHFRGHPARETEFFLPALQENKRKEIIM